MLTLQILTQGSRDSETTYFTRVITFIEAEVEYPAAQRTAPSKLTMFTKDLRILKLSPEQASLEKYELEDDEPSTSDINVSVNIIAEAPTRDSAISKSLELTEYEEVLAITLGGTQYPVTAFEEIVHEILNKV